MSSELHDRKSAMLGELLGELKRTRRSRAMRKNLGTGAATVLTIGAGLFVAWALLPAAPTSTPRQIATKPSSTPPLEPAAPEATSQVAIEYVHTDPSILDRVRIASNGSQVERVATRPMPEVRINDEQLAALTANTDDPLGVVRIGEQAFVVSARYEEHRIEPQSTQRQQSLQ